MYRRNGVQSINMKRRSVQDNHRIYKSTSYNRDFFDNKIHLQPNYFHSGFLSMLANEGTSFNYNWFSLTISDYGLNCKIFRKGYSRIFSNDQSKHGQWMKSKKSIFMMVEFNWITKAWFDFLLYVYKWYKRILPNCHYYHFEFQSS